MSAGLPDDDDDDRAKPNLIGEVLANRYQIESHLGEGAMGSVFKARHVKVGRPFAVKVLHKKLVEDRKVLQRFEREAELAGRLRHPNVVGVVDVGETTDGFRYMVMDFAEGSDLATLLNEAPMPPERIINLTRQMLEGLFHAHEQGLIHRDFKPENVIIERDDHGVEVPRIVDFGIAILREGGDSSNSSGRLTTNGLVLGTPHYMAPEQAVADPIDHRIDLFALGIVIYEMLSGKLPFDGTGAEVARANLLLDPPLISQRVPFLEVDPLLEAFARRLMAKKREVRPPTAKAARELLDLISSDPAAAAAALGVPLGASSRMPAITQPTTPVGEPAAAMPRATTAPGRPPTSGPISAEFEAPPFSTPAAEPRPGQRNILTDVAEPLRYADSDEIAPQPRRNKGALIAIGVVAVAALVIFFAVRRGSSDQPTKPPEDKVVMQADPPKLPEPVKVDPKPVVPPVVDPVVVDPPVTDPPVTDPPVVAKKPDVKKPDLKKPDVKKPDLNKPEVLTPEVKPEVKPETSPEVPTEKQVISAAALYSLYQSVGSELAQVAKINPAVASAVELDYRRIQIQNAMANEGTRAKNGADLEKMRNRLVAAKTKKP